MNPLCMTFSSCLSYLPSLQGLKSWNRIKGLTRRVREEESRKILDNKKQIGLRALLELNILLKWHEVLKQVEGKVGEKWRSWEEIIASGLFSLWRAEESRTRLHWLSLRQSPCSSKMLLVPSETNTKGVGGTLIGNIKRKMRRSRRKMTKKRMP